MNILIRTNDASCKKLLEDALPERSLNLFYTANDCFMEYTLTHGEIDVVMAEVSYSNASHSLDLVRSIRQLAPEARLVCFSTSERSSIEDDCRSLGALGFIDFGNLSDEGLRIRIGRIFADVDSLSAC